MTLDIATIIFMVVGLLFIVFAAVALLATVRGASKVAPLEDGTKLGFQQRLAIVNEIP
jgi:hypothetical protein